MDTGRDRRTAYRGWILEGISMCTAEGTGWDRLKITSVSGFYESWEIFDQLIWSELLNKHSA